MNEANNIACWSTFRYVCFCRLTIIFCVCQSLIKMRRAIDLNALLPNCTFHLRVLFNLHSILISFATRRCFFWRWVPTPQKVSLSNSFIYISHLTITNWDEKGHGFVFIIYHLCVYIWEYLSTSITSLFYSRLGDTVLVMSFYAAKR